MNLETVISSEAWSSPPKSPQVLPDERLPEAIHVILGTFRRHPFFKDPVLASSVLSQLDSRPQALSAVLMPTHLHLIVRGSPPRELVDDFRQSSTRCFWRCGYRGHLWQRASLDFRLLHRSALLETMRFILANPVREGLTAAAEDYPWRFVKL